MKNIHFLRLQLLGLYAEKYCDFEIITEVFKKIYMKYLI